MTRVTDCCDAGYRRRVPVPNILTPFLKIFAPQSSGNCRLGAGQSAVCWWTHTWAAASMTI